jgi:hypothetical protein
VEGSSPNIWRWGTAGAGGGCRSSVLESESSAASFSSMSMPVAAGVATATGDSDELAESLSREGDIFRADLSRAGDEGSKYSK